MQKSPLSNPTPPPPTDQCISDSFNSIWGILDNDEFHDVCEPEASDRVEEIVHKPEVLITDETEDCYSHHCKHNQFQIRGFKVPFLKKSEKVQKLSR